MNLVSLHKAFQWTFLALIIGSCLFESSPFFKGSREIFLALQDFQVRSLLLFCLALWFATLCFLMFNLNDLLLIGLWFIAIAACFTSTAAQLRTDSLTFLAGVTLGKGTRFALMGTRRREIEDGAEKGARNQNSEVRIFLIGLIGLLAFAAWWHLDMSDNFYHGPRWMGLWDNPNTYGMLMSAGVVLAIGLLARSQKLLKAILFIAAAMLDVGLVMSYSRGAWLAAGVGLFYLAWFCGKLKWRYVALGIGLGALGALCLWGRTLDSAPWYIKRADLGRSSAQHRVTAWRAGLEIMRDHPFGVGWNNTVNVYAKNYSPPEGGAAAITTNDYLMLGTELGIPALLCFVAYVGLMLKS